MITFTLHAAHPAPPQHLVVFAQDNHYAAWPASGGLWTWENGREALVGFNTGPYLERRGHNVREPYRNRLARTRDGGESWTVEEPANYPQTGEKTRPFDLKVRLTEPDAALRFLGTGYHGNDFAAGAWTLSPDRGKTWQGPFALTGWNDAAELQGWEFTGGTEYLIEKDGSVLAFFSARPRGQVNGDRVFCANVSADGKRCEFRGWITPPDDPVRALMPCTVRTKSGELVSVVRRIKADDVKHGRLDAFASRDDGRTWKLLGEVAKTGPGNGNPAALVILPDGRLCCAYGVRGTGKLQAKLSTDGTKWSEEPITLRDDFAPDRFGDQDFGYPRMFVRPDGKLATVYYWRTAERKENVIAATIWTPPEK